MPPATVVAVLTGSSPDAVSTATLGILLTTTTVLLICAIRRLRGTTLIAPALWTLGACGSVAGVEMFLAISLGHGEVFADPLRYAAALTVFCPPLAVMGAKRPQHKPWQFVVLSLWAVLSLPALEVLVIRPGRPLDVEGLRAWFLPVLILLGLANQLGTRYWPSAVLGAASQTTLLLPFFPVLRYAVGAWGVVVALALVDLALLLVMLGLPLRRADRIALNRLWFDFRDMFGVLWSLRLAEQFNSTASSLGWNVTLQWDGFHTPAGERLGETPEASSGGESDKVLRQNLKNLLRRFVSPAWIERRLDEKAGGDNKQQEDERA